MKLVLLLQVLSAASSAHLNGPWSAALDLAGGQLPFDLNMRSSPLGGQLCNANTCQPFSSVRWQRDTLLLEMADYAAAIKATVHGDSLTGFYHNVGSRGPRTIPFRASRGRRPITPGPRQLLGSWNATFFQDLGTSPRVFEFSNGRRGLEARISSNTSDYGPFAGTTMADSFALGLFDGSFVYLLTGKLVGDTLRGIFHAGLKSQTPWVAVRSSGSPHLRSPTEISSADTSQPLRFGFPDLSGRMFRSDDPRIRGKVVLLEILGSWCPTCHEATPTLLRLYQRYHSRGLEVIGLAFEATGDTAVDAAQARRFRDKFNIPFPILLAGVNDEQSIAEALPQLRDVTAFPTTVFLGRDGRVRWMYAGYHGFSRGKERLLEFDKQVVRLLSEHQRR
ncbi:MAG TPA: TlpA disulfide reductase family protein [Gemmatimonadales bacterium]|nr:TlpA disulfide reductase family protein [Gemmatimonadales bacterium]